VKSWENGSQRVFVLLISQRVGGKTKGEKDFSNIIRKFSTISRTFGYRGGEGGKGGKRPAKTAWRKIIGT
jgi:hypothetical protein